ncbi:MAG: OmpA family protein [Proteobacteria bacterium]|nr:OmpA family protein [Pseudomonadota bacterium]
MHQVTRGFNSRTLLSAAVFCAMLVPTLLPAPVEAKPGSVCLAKQRNLWEVGVYLGAFFPDAQHELYENGIVPHRPFDDVSFSGGLRLAYLPLSWIGIEAEAGWMPTQTEANDASANIYTLRGHVLAQYPGRIAPFVLAGAGLLGVSSGRRAAGDDADLALHWGVGLKYYVEPSFAVRLEGRHIPTKGLGKDNFANHFEALFGLSYIIGLKRAPAAPSDSDGDGLLDTKDACPNLFAQTPDGCPPRDSDGDGVLDDHDKCPLEVGASADGCPVRDRDGDGVADDQDACPTKAARTPDGCPLKDTDQDGIPDAQDQCPDQPGSTPNGCPPDADGDGVIDALDKCVNEPETVNGYQDADGCPDKLPKAVQRFTGTIRGITFESGSAKIRKSSFARLDAAIKVLQEYGDLRLRVRGHTDTTGTRELNLALSAERAEAVKTYLVGKGVAAERLKAEGLGPDEPVASNVKAAGRAENRRIEFRLETTP